MLIGTAHSVVVLPAQASPRHSRKVPPAPGLAVRMTPVPLGKLAVQLPVHPSIPAGLLLTLPALLPVTVTVRR